MHKIFMCLRQAYLVRNGQSPTAEVKGLEPQIFSRNRANPEADTSIGPQWHLMHGDLFFGLGTTLHRLWGGVCGGDE
jgi:hypothetical protein